MNKTDSGKEVMFMKNLILGGQAIITGEGSLKSLEKITATKVFIVTGGGSMIANGTIAQIESMLQKKNCESCLYAGISKNPDTLAIMDGLHKMRQFNPDTVIAVGGGSPLDAAKVMVLLYDYPEITFDNILSLELPEKRHTQLIAIPSTSGTGSEVTKSAVVTFKEKNLKIGLKSPALIPDLAILDPQITMTMPPNIVAETGMDAMTHAVECYLNTNLDDFTEVLAKGAVAGLFEYLPISYQLKTLESREKVHNYQCIAGVAFTNVGLGMVHGIAHAMGGKFNLGHGLLNAIALPYILQYNSQDQKVNQRLKKLAAAISSQDFIQSIFDLNEKLQIPKSFGDIGISQEEWNDSFAELVENSLQGSTRVNPIPMNTEKMAALLTCIFKGKLG